MNDQQNNVSPDNDDIGEETRLRLVKKSDARKIDLAVCLSMGAAECLRLQLD